MANTRAVRLQGHQLIEDAALQAGVGVPADAELVSRVVRLVDRLKLNDLAPYDQVAAREQLVQVLSARLRVAWDRQRIGGIADERVDRPIFIIGFPRTGTSLLHALLAQSPEHRVPKWWFTRESSPPPGEGYVSDYRLKRAARDMDGYLNAIPGLLQLHPYWDLREEAIIEDEEIFAFDFHGVYPSLMYRIPSDTLFIAPEYGKEAFRFHRQLLQHMQWNLPGKRWVTKGTMHQFNLDSLFAEYPDALCLWPHRDPAEVHVSTLAIQGVCVAALTRGHTDLREFADHYVTDVRAAIHKVVASPLTDDPRIYHIRFQDLARDPVGVIKRAYEHWSLPVPSEFEAGMRSWLDDPKNRADRYGRFAYSAEHFGLDAKKLRTMFADYSDKFRL